MKVLITGGARGIGKASISLMLESKLISEIYFTCRCPEKGREALNEFSSKNSEKKLEFFLLDVLEENSMKKFSEEILKRKLVFDVVVQNAGVDFHDKSAENWRKIIQTNFVFPYELSKIMIDQNLVREGGRIVFISSRLGVLSSIQDNKQAKLALSCYKSREFTEEDFLKIFGDYQKDALDLSKLWGDDYYGQSKMFLTIGANVLAKKYKNFEFLAIHPGFVLTDMTKDLGAELPPSEAASNVLFSIFEKIDPETNGEFFRDRKITSILN